MLNPNLQKKIEIFSNLSDQDCALIMQNNLLEALDDENVYFEWELISKIVPIGYEVRAPFVNFLAGALKNNRQNLGGATVGRWIIDYAVKFNPTNRKPDSFFAYVEKNQNTQKMSDREKITLLRILRLYDYLLTEPFFDLEDRPVAAILKYAIRPDQSLEEIKKQTNEAIFENEGGSMAGLNKDQMKSIDLKEALRQFPRVGEQLATGSMISLKGFDRPARPSVKNWLYDYASHLGQGSHDSMQRMNYMFSSENGKNLSSPEREKLGIILRSFDENTPLTIDVANHKIVFSRLESNEKPSRNVPPVAADKRSVVSWRSGTDGGAERDARNLGRTVFQKTAPPQPSVSATPAQQAFTRPFVPPVQNIPTPPKPQAQSANSPSSFTKPYGPISKTPEKKPELKSPATAKPVPAGNIVNLAQASQPTPVPSAPKIQPLAAKTQNPPNFSKSSGQSFQSAAQPDMQFYNPYPIPETHRVEFDQIAAPIAETAELAPPPIGKTFNIEDLQEKKNQEQSPVRVKGFSEGTASLKTNSPNIQGKKIINPHPGYASFGTDVPPEPKINGNIVDLSGQ